MKNIFKRENVQLIIACICILAGLTLLFMGFWVVPLAQIHNSIQIAFGEISTFSGALIGIDYRYRFTPENKK